MNVTVCLITYNEFEILPRCLKFIESLRNVTHVDILDSFSNDGTWEMIQEYAKTSKKQVHAWQEKTEKFTLTFNSQWDQVPEGWIIRIDADETYTQTLDDEILKLIANNGPYDLYDVVSIVLASPKERYTYQGYSTRIFKKGAYRYAPGYPFKGLFDPQRKATFPIHVRLKDGEQLKSYEALLTKGKHLEELGHLGDMMFEAYGLTADYWAERKVRAQKEDPKVPLEPEFYDVTTEG